MAEAKVVRIPTSAEDRLELAAGTPRAASLPLALIAIAVVALVALTYTTQTSRLATAGIEMQRLEARRALLLRENQHLLVQVSRYQALPHVERMALEKLKMVRPDPRSIHYLTLAAPPAALTTAPSAPPSQNPPAPTSMPVAGAPTTAPPLPWWVHLLSQIHMWSLQAVGTG